MTARPSNTRRINADGCLRLARGLLLTLAAASTLLWLASGVWSFDVVSPGYRLQVDEGLLSATHIVSPVPRTAPTGLTVSPRPDRGWYIDLWLQPSSTHRSCGVASYMNINGFGIVLQRVTLTLWLPPLLLCAASALVHRRLRRALPGLCPACRYDRAGLDPAAPCPECGLAATSSPRPPAP